MHRKHANNFRFSQRRRLTFDCLEERWLPSFVGPVVPETQSQIGEHAAVRRDFDNNVAPPDNGGIVLPSALAAGLSNATAANPIAVHVDEDPNEAADDFAEVISWFWKGGLSHGMTDDDWLEDLQEFYSNYPNIILPVFVTSLPPVLNVNESQNIELSEAAESPVAGAAKATAAVVPQVQTAAKQPAVPAVRQPGGKELPPNPPAKDALVWQPALRARKSSLEPGPKPNNAPTASDAADSAGLIQDAVFASLTNLEMAMRRFLDGFEQGVDNMLGMFENKSLAPWIASALLSAAAIELARRQLCQQTAALDNADLPTRTSETA